MRTVLPSADINNIIYQDSLTGRATTKTYTTTDKCCLNFNFPNGHYHNWVKIDDVDISGKAGFDIFLKPGAVISYHNYYEASVASWGVNINVYGIKYISDFWYN